MTAQYERSIRTCVEMLEDRGYALHYDSDDASDPIPNVFYNAETEDCVGFVVNQFAMGVNDLHKIMVSMAHVGISHAIIVSMFGLTHGATAVLKESKPLYDIEIFDVGKTQFNLTKHVMVPKHVRLTPLAADFFVKAYGKNIPVILSTDPVALYFGYSRDDIIRIHRDDNTVSYRIVK